MFERDPAKGKFGIEFRMQKPKNWHRWQRSPPLPTTIDNPIGIDGVLESLTPPYVKSMDDAVDKVIEEKLRTGWAPTATTRSSIARTRRARIR